MTADDDSELPLGERLIRRGWVQGAIFRAPEVCCVSYGPGKDKSQVTLRTRKPRSKERYVVISQDCDILDPDGAEPYVDALLCVVEKDDRFLDRLEHNRNSARWFVVDRPARLVARAFNRVAISKSLLLELDPPESRIVDAQRITWFRNWLGRRFDRPALEPHIEDDLQRPTQSAIDELCNSTPDVVTSFWHSVREVRISGPSTDGPPHTCQFVLILRSDAITDDGLTAIETVMREIHNRIPSNQIRLSFDLVYAPSDISLADYEATWLLPLTQVRDRNGDS